MMGDDYDLWKKNKHKKDTWHATKSRLMSVEDNIE